MTAFAAGMLMHCLHSDSHGRRCTSWLSCLAPLANGRTAAASACVSAPHLAKVPDTGTLPTCTQLPQPFLQSRHTVGTARHAGPSHWVSLSSSSSTAALCQEPGNSILSQHAQKADAAHLQPQRGAPAQAIGRYVRQYHGCTVQNAKGRRCFAGGVQAGRASSQSTARRSRWLVGSSSSSTVGLMYSARARLMRMRQPARPRTLLLCYTFWVTDLALTVYGCLNPESAPCMMCCALPHQTQAAMRPDLMIHLIEICQTVLSASMMWC